MPIATIPIADYKPFYIQVDGAVTAVDTRTEWGMIIKSNPYIFLPNPKDCYVNDWKDENGDDEYNTEMYYEAFEFECEFYLKATAGVNTTASAELQALLDDFFDAVHQKEFKIFDTYTQKGFQKVRYAGYENEEYKARGNWARQMFRIKFKVNDPVTKMKMSNGAIVTV